MDRRDFLKKAALGAAGLTLAGCDTRLLDAFNKGEEKLWGLNVHPFDEPYRSAQIQALRQLGIRRIRMTLGLHRDLAAPYLRTVSAEWVGIVGDFNDPIPNAGTWPELVRKAVRRSSQVRFFEILNEPVQIQARTYVESYLKPAYQVIKNINPSYQVVAGAPTGTSGGRTWFYQMTEAGADSWCDYRAAHLYQNNPEILLAGTRRPFMVTESGVQDRARHVDWWTTTMTRMSGVLSTDRLYWYTLLDIPDNDWSLISSRSRAGRIDIVSPLYDYIRSTYGS